MGLSIKISTFAVRLSGFLDLNKLTRYTLMRNNLRLTLRLHWLFVVLLTFAAQMVQAQVLKPASWSYDVSKKEVKVGDEVELIFNVKI
ncbi:proteiN-disulfide reductase, partial [Pontibacter sp. BAB1700]